VLTEEALGENFFNLSSGIAGELMQKFIIYNQRLAIIVRDVTVYSSSLQALVYEHTNHSNIRFLTREEEAYEWLNSLEKKHD